MGPEGLANASGLVPVMCVLGMALAPLLTGMTLGFTSPTVDTMKGSVQWSGAPVATPADLLAQPPATHAIWTSLQAGETVYSA